ncbi:MAG: hypothetical protein IKO55_13830 [Kiritimatiellae bacterium]|nr:hypothetical protein [Kiritimatiellia bacterium]
MGAGPTTAAENVTFATRADLRGDAVVALAAHDAADVPRPAFWFSPP